MNPGPARPGLPEASDDAPLAPWTAGEDPRGLSSLDPGPWALALALTLPFLRDRRAAAERIDEALAHALDAVPPSSWDRAAPLERRAESAPYAPREALARGVLREALARLLDDAVFAGCVVWPVRDAMRSALDALDAWLDEDASGWFSPEEDGPGADLREVRSQTRAVWSLGVVPTRAGRVERSLRLAWSAMSPPRSRRAARMIDLAERAPPSIRGVILSVLAREGVDVRGVLDGDPDLSPDARVDILAGRPRGPVSIAWEPDPARVLAAHLADWSRYASSPRTLFLQCAHAVGPDRWRAVLAHAGRWPLALEVRAERARWEDRALVRVRADPRGPGRYACARCGACALRAEGGHRAEPPAERDAPSTGELEFVCNVCALRYHAAWERDTVGEALPEAWVIAE